MRTHLLDLFWGGGDHHREGIFESMGGGIRVEDGGRGDF